MKLEFSETVLYSASTEQTLVRIREYNEDSGLWALRYENLDGTAYIGVVPADANALSAQIQVVRTLAPGCAAGVSYSQRDTSKFDSETGALESAVIDWVDAAGVASATMPVGFSLGACTSKAYAETYRLAWDQAGAATATTGANTPAGAVIGSSGDTVTIAGPVHSLSWKWLPATTPVPDLLNPPAILDPVVTVNGLAYVATVPNPLFSQQYSQTYESNLGELIGDWAFTVADGAFIEITVLKAA
jgi:hypothetical protein